MEYLNEAEDEQEVYQQKMAVLIDSCSKSILSQMVWSYAELMGSQDYKEAYEFLKEEVKGAKRLAKNNK